MAALTLALPTSKVNVGKDPPQTLLRGGPDVQLSAWLVAYDH